MDPLITAQMCFLLISATYENPKMCQMQQDKRFAACGI